MTAEMLKAFLSPAAPARVLEYFFLNPLGRLLESDLGTGLELAPLRLLIPRLVQAGLLIREEEGRGGKKVYFRANLDSPLFAELRSLFLDYRKQIGAPGVPPTWGGPISESRPVLLREGPPRSEKPEPVPERPVPLTPDDETGKPPSRLEDCLPLGGTSPAIRETRRQLQRLLPLDVAIFLTGESGTGKEGVARALHEAVLGASVRFFSVTCGSFSAQSVDLLLFGQEKGPVSERRPGLLGSPGGGTVFLRDIPSLPLTLQKKLFRAMEGRQYVPVDGLLSLPVNVRLIFGSTRSLGEDVEAGTVLRELHSMLALYQVRIPPLRERPEDLPLLADRLVSHWCQKRGRAPVRLEQEALRDLLGRPWPGNLRELSGVLERAVNLLEGSSIGRSDLPSWTGPQIEPPHDTESLKEARRNFVHRHVASTLRKYGGDKIAAARALQIDLSTLYRFLQESTPYRQSEDLDR